MGFLYFIDPHLYTSRRHFSFFTWAFEEDSQIDARGCCAKHPKKCNQHKILCNRIDVGYQSKLNRFNGLVGSMNSKAGQMRQTIKGTNKLCGKMSVPSFRVQTRK